MSGIQVPGGGSTGKGGDDGARDAALATLRLLEYKIASRTLRLVSTSSLVRPRVLGDSILLPDGTVPLVNGASVGFANNNSHRVTASDDLATAPHVVLIRCSSTTHSLNSLLRLWVENRERGVLRGSLDVTMVSNATFAPPGFYLLFVLSERGVPSVGQMVRVGT